MRNHSKFTALALALLMLITVLSLPSCSNNPGGDEETSTNAPIADSTTAEPEVTKSKYDIGDEVSESLKFNNEVIKFVSRDDVDVGGELTVEDNDGGIINTAVEKRTSIVENRLGVTIDNTKVKGNAYVVSDIVRNQAKAEHVYDIFANSMYSTIMYTTENCFANLTTIENLDLSRPYWSQGFNNAASIGKNQYLCTGAAALSTYRFVFVTFFNADMFSEKEDIPSLYETVNKHKWTIDYQMEICSSFWVDTDGDQVASGGDTCGFASNAGMIWVDGYWSSFNLPIITKDTDNMLQWSLDSERTVNAVEKMQKLYWETVGAVRVDDIGSSSIPYEMVMFSEGRAAMTTRKLMEVENEYLRNMSDSYGIVPMPLLDESQENYASYAHDQVTAFGITNTTPADRLDMLGAVLEVFAAESYKTVTPAYYEVALKSKYASDPESWAMLDIVTENLYIDPGVLYTKKLSSIHQCFRTYVGENQTAIASRLKSLSNAAKMGVSTLNSEFEKLFAMQ